MNDEVVPRVLPPQPPRRTTWSCNRCSVTNDMKYHHCRGCNLFNLSRVSVPRPPLLPSVQSLNDRNSRLAPTGINDNDNVPPTVGGEEVGGGNEKHETSVLIEHIDNRASKVPKSNTEEDIKIDPFACDESIIGPNNVFDEMDNNTTMDNSLSLCMSSENIESIVANETELSEEFEVQKDENEELNSFDFDLLSRKLARSEALFDLGVGGAGSSGPPAAIAEAEAKFFMVAEQSMIGDDDEGYKETEDQKNENDQENDSYEENNDVVKVDESKDDKTDTRVDDVEDDDEEEYKEKEKVDMASEYHASLLRDPIDLTTGLTFESMSNRNMSKHQKNVLRKYKKKCCKLVEYMMTLGLIFDPGSYLYSKLLNKDELLDVNNKNNHIYSMPLGLKLKVGQTSKGKGRIANYKKNGVEDPILHSIIDLDKIATHIQSILTERILKIAKMFSPKEYPTTWGQVLLDDKAGLPIAVQIRFLSLVKSAEECKNCGGALKLKGVLLACARFIFETGVQVMLKNRGVDITGDKHEAVLNDCTRLAVNLGEEVNNNVDQFIDNVLSEKEKQYIIENPVIPSDAINSWAPCELASTPKKFVSATGVVMDKIFEEEWSDAFVNKPYHVRYPDGVCSSIEEAFDAKGGYTDKDRRRAIDKLKQGFQKVETNGGVMFCDTNDEAFMVMETSEIIKYLTTEHETPFGNKWIVIHTYRGITVLKLKHKDDELLRIIVVFRPLCTMMHSIAGQSIQMDKLVKYLDAACTAQWLFVFTRLMSNVGSEQVISNRSLDRKTEDSFVLNVCFFVSDVCFLHISPMISVHLFKNGLSGENKNLNDSSCTNLLRKRNSSYFGRRGEHRLRRHRNDSIESMIDAEEEGDDNKYAEEDTVEADDDDSTEDKEGDDNSEDTEGDDNSDAEEQGEDHVDRCFHMHAIAMGTCGPENNKEVAEAIFKEISYDRKRNQPFMHNKGRRINKLAKYLPKEIMNLLMRLNEASSPKTSQIKDVNTSLMKFALTQEKFFIQLDGKAVSPPINGAYSGVPGSGEPFVMPADQTKINAVPESGLNNVVIFDIEKFVPITWSGLENRVSPSKAKQYIKASTSTNGTWRAVKFSDYKVEYTKSIAKKGSGNKIQYANKHRVVEVWFVPRQKMVDTREKVMGE